MLAPTACGGIPAPEKNGNDNVVHCSFLFMWLHEIDSCIRDMVNYI
jgi:hypothetical protein